MDNTGHRERLRQKILKGPLEIIPDYELLEYFLTYSIPRKDTKETAKMLIKNFGSLNEVLNASTEQLEAQAGIKDNTIALFKTFLELSKRLLEKELTQKPIFDHIEQIYDYCYTLLCSADNETFYVLYLNSKNKLICSEKIRTGTVNHVPIYPREIVQHALNNNACGIILTHNHPSTDTHPSRDDLETTLYLKDCLEKLNINLIDHIIVSKSGCVSLTMMGYLKH